MPAVDLGSIEQTGQPRRRWSVNLQRFFAASAPALLFAAGLVTPLLAAVQPLAGGSTAAAPSRLQWHPYEVRLTAQQDHAWWTFPVTATFVHEATGTRLALEGYWDGGREWFVRFAPPLSGVWTWRTVSDDAGLNDRTGTLQVRAPTDSELAANPNYRGHVKASDNGRYFEYADGTPCFLLADTLWAGNTARCGLGAHQDGPFFQHLADRRAKGYTAILMQYFHGYGDYPDSPGHRNEGGYPYFDIKTKNLNPAYFRALDQRMHGLWERGFVAAIPTTWWGKTKNCVFTPADARRMSAYCAVRYGAFNALWSLSGEYQYAFGDCRWTAADFTALGETVQRHNPYRHPLSIHPSARLDWKAPHNVQSSRPFHGEAWLDHHWLQTGQSLDRLFNIVTRQAENRALAPPLPVFCSEASYERAEDAETAYHTRWQVWTAFLNGAAGFGYGAQGVWQFFDPADPHGETGKKTRETVPWREAARLPGSSQVVHVTTLLGRLDWGRLEPHRDWLLVDGEPSSMPTATNLRPPHCAAIPGQLYLVYLPRGNQERSCKITELRAGRYQARWFDPRTGRAMSIAPSPAANADWRLPGRPTPADEDWVLVLAAGPDALEL